jgi:Poxvirus A32 protein
MKLIPQNIRLPVTNIDMGKQVKDRTKHSALFPNSIRMMICGPSGCGKTNLAVQLITSPNGLKFENVYVYTKTLYQPKYIYLQDILKNVPEIGFETFSNTNDVIAPQDVKKNSIFIFDDVICDKQENMKNYFSMGRHKGVDSFYLCQTYTKVPKHLIRDNANIIVLFKQDDLNLKHVYLDHISPDITFEQFKCLCGKVWNEEYSFVTVDKESKLNEGRFRKGFDHYIDIHSL